MPQPMQRSDVSGQDTKPTYIRVTNDSAPWFTAGQIYPVNEWVGRVPYVIDRDGDRMIPLGWELVEVEAMADPSASGAAASAILREAADIVAGTRNGTRGDKERSFSVIASLWDAYLSGRKVQGPVTPRDVAQMMVLLKIGRTIQGTPARDHFLDAAGYSAIAGELAEVEL